MDFSYMRYGFRSKINIIYSLPTSQHKIFLKVLLKIIESTDSDFRLSVPAARRLTMATADSPGPGQQIESNTPAYGGLQLSKITEKNNHGSFNICWKCPPSSTHFWHLFTKCAFTRFNSISEIQSVSRLILAFNSSNMWGFAIFNYGGT